MKNLFLAAVILLCLTAASCSKKSNPNPVNTGTAHNIKITASGTADINTIITITKSGQTNSTVVDSKTTATGSSYTYSTVLNTGDVLDFSLQTMVEQHGILQHYR